MPVHFTGVESPSDCSSPRAASAPLYSNGTTDSAQRPRGRDSGYRCNSPALVQLGGRTALGKTSHSFLPVVQPSADQLASSQPPCCGSPFEIDDFRRTGFAWILSCAIFAFGTDNFRRTGFAWILSWAIFVFEIDDFRRTGLPGFCRGPFPPSRPTISGVQADSLGLRSRRGSDDTLRSRRGSDPARLRCYHHCHAPRFSTTRR